MIPTDDQMIILVKQRSDHAKTCNGSPTYDLSQKGRIRLTCRCGWDFTMEAGGNDKPNT